MFTAEYVVISPIRKMKVLMPLLLLASVLFLLSYSILHFLSLILLFSFSLKCAP